MACIVANMLSIAFFNFFSVSVTAEMVRPLLLLLFLHLLLRPLPPPPLMSASCRRPRRTAW